MKKVWRIIYSRLKKIKTEDFVKERRAECKKCEWNTLNINSEKLTTEQKIIKFFSDTYSYITGNAEKDVLGGCSICGCSVYFKTIDEDSCPKNKWKK